MLADLLDRSCLGRPIRRINEPRLRRFLLGHRLDLFDQLSLGHIEIVVGASDRLAPDPTLAGCRPADRGGDCFGSGAPYLPDVLRDHRKGQASAGGLGELVFRSPEGFMLTATTSSAGAATAHSRTRDCQPVSDSTTCTTPRQPSGSAGESIYFVQQQLGHADVQTTIDKYGHPDKKAHREAAARAASWWREAASE